MKKLSVLFAIVLAFCLVFAACADKSNPDADKPSASSKPVATDNVSEATEAPTPTPAPADVKNVNVYDRGIISRPGLWVLRKTAMPAALVECAFVSNPGDRQLLMDDAVLDMFALSIADGIEKSINIMKENIIKAKSDPALLQ